MGTLPYVPPEQARGEVALLDQRCDVFSLGAILCEILTGSPPYRSVARDEILRQATNGELADALARLDACEANAELVELAKSCLAPHREERPSDAGAVAKAVAAYEANVEKRLRLGEVEHAEAQVRAGEERKRRRLASILTAVVLVGLAGLAVGVVFLGQKNQQLVTTNGQLERASREAEIKGEQAVRAWDRTFQALDAMTSRVTGESLETQQAITPEQKKFLAEVLAYYQEFAREQGNDEGTRKRVAAAAYRVGIIQSRLGDLEASVRAFEQARDAYEKLAVDSPGVPQYRYFTGSSQNNLGRLFQELGRFREAEQSYRQSLVLREELASTDPGLPRYPHAVASSHNNLGVLLRDLGKRAEAEAAFRRASALWEKLATTPGFPEDRQALATSLCIHSLVLRASDKRVEAEAAYRRALELHQKLADEFPFVRRYRRELACCHNDLGMLFGDLGKEPEAEAAHRRALTLQEKLAADFSAVFQYRQDLARTHHLGSLLRSSSKRRPEAEAAYRQAIALREKLVADFRFVAECRQELADSYNNLGLVLQGRDKRPEAEAAYQQARMLEEKFIADFSAVPRYQTKLAATFINLGNLLSKDGRATESLTYFDRAITLMKPKVQAEPHLGPERQILRTAHWGRALALDKLERPAESIADWDRAVDLSLERDKATVRAVRARSLVRAGQVERAAVEATDLAKSAATATQLYDLACVYALAAGRDEANHNGHIETALKMLQRAVDCGFKDAELLKTDDDFKLLRDHEEFRKLLTQLENPQEGQEANCRSGSLPTSRERGYAAKIG